MKVENCPLGSESRLILDGWLHFKCPRRDHLVITELREVLDGILRHKVENPKKDFTEEAGSIIDAVKAILTMDEDGKVMAPVIKRQSTITGTRGHQKTGSKKSGQGGGKGSGKGKQRGRR